MTKALGWSLLGIVAVTLLLRHALGITNTTIAALGYVLVILVIASRAPVRVTVLASVAAMIPFHYLFVPVIGSFVITDPLNWFVLATFLSVGVVAGQLAESARQRADRERATQLKLQRAELSSTLLTSLSHDLRTPLAATRVAIANANDDHLSSAERQRQAAVALDQVARLDRALHDILSLARIEARGLTLDRQWVTPAEVVEAAIARTASGVADHRLVIEADDEVEGEIDPRITSAALTHVIENALQYAPVDSAITVRGWSDGTAVHFSVTDEGPGFDEREADRLFAAFYRGRAAGEIRQGTGLGLTIARGLLQAEDGSIRADRVAQGGARFSISLPARLRPSHSEESS